MTVMDAVLYANTLKVCLLLEKARRVQHAGYLVLGLECWKALGYPCIGAKQ